MKNVKIFMKRLMLTTTLSMFVLTLSIAEKAKKEADLDIAVATKNLEQAIGQRKFADAKEAVNDILPWMKQDIKKDKKTLSQIGKSIDPSEIDKAAFSAKLNKKNELYESAKHLVETSPAAIRVKGKDLVKIVNEYMALIE